MTLNNLLYTDQLLPDEELKLLMPLQTAITEATGIEFEQVEGKLRSGDIVEARHMYLTFLRFSGLSLKQAVKKSGFTLETIRHASRKMNLLYKQRFEYQLRDKINQVSELTGIEIRF